MKHLWLLGLLAFGCGKAIPVVAAPVTLSVQGDKLTLRPAAGGRINARLAPTIELASGERIVFDQGALDSDSAYFAEPPTASFRSGTALLGILRVGVCPAGLAVCQSFELPVDQLLTAP